MRYECDEDGCHAFIGTQKKRKALEYMFYHVLGTGHTTGYEEEIEEEVL